MATQQPTFSTLMLLLPSTESVANSCEHGNESFGSVKAGEFRDQETDYLVLMVDCALCSYGIMDMPYPNWHCLYSVLVPSLYIPLSQRKMLLSLPCSKLTSQMSPLAGDVSRWFNGRHMLPDHRQLYVLV